MAKSHILHLSIPDFPVAVERLHDHRLRGKPVVVGGFSGRALVDSCSAEARSCGIRPGLKLKMAQRLCPEAVVLLPDPSRYNEHGETVHSLLQNRAPVLEPVSAADYFVDLTGMDRFFGCEQWTSELQKQIVRKSGLQAAAGRSINKLVSELASARVAPNQQKAVPRPEVPRFIAPVSIRSLPLIQPETARQLSLMGVRDLATLRLLEPDLLSHAFGPKEGLLLRQFARGEDHRKVTPPPAQKIMRESYRFDGDTADTEWLRRMVQTLAEKLSFQLRKQRNTCTCLHLRIEYADHGRVHRKKRFAHPNAHSRVMVQRAELLFKQLPLRRVVVREIIVEAELGGAGTLQPSLFGQEIRTVHDLRDYMNCERGS
jgi:DNA polymerase-4